MRIVTEFSLQSSVNGSASNLSDGAGRSYATSFSSQSGAASPIFHHTGAEHLLVYFIFFSYLVNIIAKFLLQVLFKGCIVFMGALMFPTCLVLSHQETPH